MLPILRLSFLALTLFLLGSPVRAQLGTHTFTGNVTSTHDTVAFFGDSINLHDPVEISFSHTPSEFSSVVWDDDDYFWEVRGTSGGVQSASFQSGSFLRYAQNWTFSLLLSHHTDYDGFRFSADGEWQLTDAYATYWVVKMIGPAEEFPTNDFPTSWRDLLGPASYAEMQISLWVAPIIRDGNSTQISFNPDSLVAQLDASVSGYHFQPDFTAVPEPATYGALGALLLVGVVIRQRWTSRRRLGGNG